jgi:hypothetical protein
VTLRSMPGLALQGKLTPGMCMYVFFKEPEAML